MKQKNNPTIITCVEDLKNFLICASGNKIYISNRMPLKIVEGYLEILDDEIEVTIFD